MWVDVSQFEQREHGLCCTGVLTPPFRVVLKDQGAVGGGGGMAKRVVAPTAPVLLPVRESSRRLEREKQAAAGAGVGGGGQKKGKGSKGKGSSPFASVASAASSSRGRGASVRR